MNICFLETAELPADASAPMLYITSTWSAREALIAGGHQTIRLENLFSEAEGEELDRANVTTALMWQMWQDTDLTKLDNLALATPHAWAFWLYTVIPVYKFAVLLTRLLQQEQPQEILWYPTRDSRLETVLRLACERWAPRATIRVVAGSPSAATNLNPKQLRPPTISLRHRIAFAVLNVLGRLVAPDRQQRRPIVYFNYQTLNTFLLTLLQDRRFAVWFANRPTGKLWLASIRHGAQYFIPDTSALSAQDQAALAQLQTQWHVISRTPEYQARFRIDDIDLWTVLQPELDTLIDTQLPQTLKLMRGCQKRLARLRPGCLALPTDIPYLHRVLVEATRSLNIPSVVLLHGLPYSHNQCGEDLQADYVFAWGPAMIDQFVAIGSAPGRIIPIGFPNLDQYHTLRVARRRSISQPARVLILTRVQNFSKVLCTADEPVVYLHQILSAMKELPGIELMLRPHPGEVSQYYRDLLVEWSWGHVPVRDDGPITPLLVKADLIIGEYSTVCVEALALGIPYLCVRFHRYRYDRPFDGQSGIEVITEPQVLRERVQQFLDGTFEDTTAKILAQYAGPLDGHSTERVLDALAQIADRGKLDNRPGEQA